MTTDTETANLQKRKDEVQRQLQETGRSIAAKITELKERRERRNTLTALAQEAKVQRRDLSKVIKEKIAVVKTLREKLPDKPSQQPKPVQRGEDRVSPGKLREEIQKIETKIETSALPYNEEKKLTKLLKEKKGQLAKLGGDTDLEKDVRAKSKEIDKLKRESDVAHEAVTKAAKESQEFHERILILSEEIESLKTQETTLRDEYNKLREALNGPDDELPGKKPRVKSKNNSGQPSAEDKAVIQVKAAEVEQKVKDKKKLTTEDLLAFQAHK